jgi:hypothetical protein
MYRSGSRSVTIRKRLEVMSRQCEMMENEKVGLQKALSDRKHEISSLLSTKEHVQIKYQDLLSQLAHWRAALESDDAVQVIPQNLPFVKNILCIYLNVILPKQFTMYI